MWWSSSGNNSSELATSSSTLTDLHEQSTVYGPLHIDPLDYTETLFFGLGLFILYLLLPRGYRVQYMGAYPRRYAWSKKIHPMKSTPMMSRPYQDDPIVEEDGSVSTATSSYRPLKAQGVGLPPTADTNSNIRSFTETPSTVVPPRDPNSFVAPFRDKIPSVMKESPGSIVASSIGMISDDIAISATMQLLREEGIALLAHGSKGKPKQVRLQLTETAITWRTESRKVSNNNINKKLGKLHQVPLNHIVYVNIGKQTSALRRVENVGVNENVCFSLLTKEGSLDLECPKSSTKDALVQCFSMILDEVHGNEQQNNANWRNVYRAPSSDMPSSFDDFDVPESTNPKTPSNNNTDSNHNLVSI